ncbi:DUF397 domain-containing protein [Streptomyces sp. NPDC087212]|uniref:DUF397 domain-containing protein n=1 Tax=Streptomyces sp. NPDC087212 TaxID=3365766 RepID=UPI003807B3FA
MSSHIKDASTLSGWRKSSHSGAQGGSCIEVLDGYRAGVPVRDSKAPAGPAVVFGGTTWGLFVNSVKCGDL